MSARSLTARVRRLEQSRRTSSPFVAAFGTFAAFEEYCARHMADGVLDPRDFSVVVLCVRGWERSRVWGD